MSAIASFYRVREPDLQGLRNAATHDGFWDYLRAHAEPVLEFDGSGYIFATLLPFLDEKHGMGLMTSPRDDLANLLSEACGSTFFVFTMDHRARHLDALDAKQFDGAELRGYYDEFNETEEPSAAEAMSEGLKALRAALHAVESDAVVLLHIG